MKKENNKVIAGKLLLKILDVNAKYCIKRDIKQKEKTAVKHNSIDLK